MPRWNPVVFTALLSLSLSTAQAACLDEARTPYEKAYCQIVEKGEGGGLPSFEDFRRNTPRVQALLLKRPAVRAGIELPQRAQNRNRARDRALPSRQPSNPPSPRSEVSSSLDQCQLEGRIISCPGVRYRLAGNRPNSDLAPGALGPANTLDLPDYQGSLDDEAAVRRYLSGAYDRYIPKMVEIGLAGVTMSFSEFYHRFRRHAEQGVDFTRRLEQTYQLLKQDKRTKAVASRLNRGVPHQIEHCARINIEILVCDNVSTNWVYVKQ
ncbi:hypothetical protein QQM79_08715 [Marinobacteraceae bacterium S3BR75-40.1]